MIVVDCEYWLKVKEISSKETTSLASLTLKLGLVSRLKIDTDGD